MTSGGSVLLLVGSAKGPRSTSQSLGTYLCQRLRERRFATETLLVHQSLESDEHYEALLAATDRADILVIAFPLYADSVPYVVVRAMELVAEHRNHARRQAGGDLKKQRLIAIVNSGFPEARQNDTALAICRQFAWEAGFEWAGGLALGGGPAINGQPLSKAGGVARNAILALDLTAAALGEDKPVPQWAKETMAKPFAPVWVYVLMGGIGTRWQARKRGIRNLHARPYQR